MTFWRKFPESRPTLYDEQNSIRQLADKLEALRSVEQHNQMLKMQIVDLEILEKDLKQQLVESSVKASVLSEQIHSQQLEVVVAQAKLESQQSMMVELRAYIGLKGEISSNGSSPT